MAEAELVFEAANMLGEGPTWSEEEQALYWVGIIDKKIHRLEPSSGVFRTWDAPDFVGTMALRARGGAIVALASSICLLDFATGSFTELCRPEADRPDNRFNDGKCDRQGRFWVGSMQTNLNPDGSPRPITETSGALWRIDPDGTATDMTGPTIRLSNTLAWSADNRTMYFGDSLEQTIYAYDFDPAAGTIANRRVFARTEGYGVPDGSAIDEEGFLWNARFGGGCVIRYAPDGTIDRIVDVPATNPTSCTFGGSDRRTLFITSAREGLSAAEIASNPREGDLFALDAGVTGPPDVRFAG